MPTAIASDSSLKDRVVLVTGSGNDGRSCAGFEEWASKIMFRGIDNQRHATVRRND